MKSVDGVDQEEEKAVPKSYIRKSNPKERMTDRRLSIPTCSEEVTTSWFAKILNLPEYEIQTFNTSSNPSTRSGNLSNIITVEFSRVGNKEKCNYIVKLLPLDAPEDLLNVIYSEKFDQKEVFFYSQLLPVLLDEVPELKKYLCGFHYAEVQEADETRPYGSVIVLEDLTPLKYYTPTFDIGLSEEHISQAIDFAVKLNVAGQLVQRRTLDIPLPDIYKNLQDFHIPCDSGNVFEKFKTLGWFPPGIQCIDEVLAWNPKSTPEIRLAFQKLLPFAERILYVVLKEGQKFASIVHDDLWPHNFLLQPKDSNSNLPIKIIDWQTVGYTDPIHDLSHFLFSCLPVNDLNEVKIKGLVTKYYEEYEKLCIEKKLKIGRTKEEFLKHFFTYGVSYALIWFALSCDSIFAKQEYIPKLYSILELLYELKAPEFLLSLVEK